MGMQEIIKQQNSFFNDVHKQMCEDHKTIIRLADDMTECATNMSGQGYQPFIASREKFIDTVSSFERDYKLLFCSKVGEKNDK